MKELWVQIDQTLPHKKKKVLAENIVSICDAVVVSNEDVDLFSQIGFKKIVSPQRGGIKLVNFKPPYEEMNVNSLNIAVRITIKGRSDEEAAEKLLLKGVEYIIADCPEWKIIPLENLIAKTIKYTTKLIAAVNNSQEVKTSLETLEVGVDGILLLSNELGEIKKASKLLNRDKMKINLEEAEVINIKPLSTGARACVDTVSLMDFGEGLLVGSQSSGLFLAQAEVKINPHVNPRPFRVNAGPVSSYVLTQEGKTRYLSELKTGDEILIVNRNGSYRSSNIGRIKIELRPLLLIETKWDNQKFDVILQNAETIHMVTRHGSKSVSELKKGDKVLIKHEKGGRHFGMLVEEETVIER